jgi:DNA (cytosine-5)-methyltransferase 1
MADLTGADGGLRELALFAGAGGGILGGHLLGWRTVCAVEWEPYAASVLAQRQNDGLLPPFPIWDDVQTFDGKPWRGVVDVVSGGFPCQDISVAGKGAGISGKRSGMWSHMARIIGEVRPRFAFVENSPALLTRGLGAVLSDLASLGYDCKWTVLGAADVGAPHQRDRFWLAAHANSMREPQPQGGISDIGRRPGHCGEKVPDANGWGGLPWGLGRKQCTSSDEEARERIRTLWAAEPDVGRMAHGVAARVDRLRAIGNGQVPQCSAQAWRLLTDA